MVKRPETPIRLMRFPVQEYAWELRGGMLGYARVTSHSSKYRLCLNVRWSELRDEYPIRWISGAGDVAEETLAA